MGSCHPFSGIMPSLLNLLLEVNGHAAICTCRSSKSHGREPLAANYFLVRDEPEFGDPSDNSIRWLNSPMVMGCYISRAITRGLIKRRHAVP